MTMDQGQYAPTASWVYDIFLWTFSILVDLFFREVHPRGAYRIPKRGPIIFVAAPHANQFVDPLILMRAVKQESNRRISILIAEKSMRRKFIGFFARLVGAVPVARALDLTKPGSGRIYLAEPDENPLLIRGEGTKFTKEASVNGLLVLPTPADGGSAASAEILEIKDDETILLKKEFKGSAALQQLTGEAGSGGKGTKYKVAPKVDQTQVYEAVFQRLNEGGCVGIFPEGGSHDRTELLPLKAGVAIMALGALSVNPDSGLKIIPCGMNYFHAHKFRSRAVIEFGSPIEISPELVHQYSSGEKREAVKTLLDNIYHSLLAVTVPSPDYDTLMVIQAARRLYRPTNKKLPLPMVVELNRRLITGYTQFKDDPRIINLLDGVRRYNTQLRHLGLRDHQVEYAKFSTLQVIGKLGYRLAKLAILSLFSLPGILLFAPVFVATKIISRKRAAEALKASTVKVQGKDVMATWKLLVALALAPSLYSFYTFVLTFMTYENRVWGYVPQWVPLWMVVIFGYIFFPGITYAALRIGEVGMDIFKSLRPLVLSMNPTSSNTLHQLREQRERLAIEVGELINTLGPSIFPDFDNSRIIADPFSRAQNSTSVTFTGSSPIVSRRGSEVSNPESEQSARPFSPSSPTSTMSSITLPANLTTHQIPRNESFGNLGSIGLFASRPASRARSRSNSGGFHVKALSGMEGGANFEEVSRRLKERRRERNRASNEDWDDGDDGEIVEMKKTA